MRRTYFVRKDSLPKDFFEKMQNMATSETLLSLGLGDSVLTEMKSREDAVLRCRRKNDGLLFWVDYKHDPTAIEVMFRLIYYCVVLGLSGAALALIGNRFFGLQPNRFVIYTTRGIFLAVSGVSLVAIQNRYDRCLFPIGFFVTATSLSVTTIGLLVYLFILDDVIGILWILFLAVSWRRYWAEPLDRD